jgi:hypothetical protein
MADTSSVALRYVEESTWGTTPSAALQILRMTSEDFDTDKGTMVSEEITGDAQVGGVIETSYKGVGNLNGELSFTTYDEFLTAGIRALDFGAATTVTASTIAATSTQITDSGNGFGDFVAGQFVKVTGFATASLNTIYLVTAAAAGALTVFPAPATTEAATASVTVQGAVKTNGTEKRSFSFEKQWSDLSSKYMNWTGVRCGGWQLSFDAEDKVKVTFPFSGKTGNTAAATIGTGSHTAATTTTIINAISDLTFVGEGTTQAALTLRGADINVACGPRHDPVAGSTDPFQIGLGTVEISGQIRLYLSDTTYLNKMLNHTLTSLSFGFTDEDGNAYGIYLPSVRFTQDKAPTGGRDQTVGETIDFVAHKDATTGYTIHLTKMSAS